MLRFCLCRLRGRGLPARPLRISPETNLPLTIERVLRRLESFPVETREKTGKPGMAHLIATLAEGRAIQTRLRARFDPCLPGGSATLLATVTSIQFRSDEELAQRLPSIDVLPEWVPMRRPARSLLAVAARLELLAAADPLRDLDPTLASLVSGTRILAAEASIRAAALELWSVIDQPVRDKFVQMPPNLADWNLDSAALLYQEQPELLAAQSRSERTNVRSVFQQLQRATLDGQPVKWNVLAGITPLGWLVVLGTLTGGLSGGDWRGSLANSDMIKTQGHNVFEPLVTALALANDDDDDLPWGGLRSIAEAWSVQGTQFAFEALNQIDVAAGLVVSTHQSARFQIEASRRGPTEVQTSDGLRRLPGWAISWAKTINESRNGIEQIARTEAEGRAVFRWSETWRENRLIGVGVVQSAMAALAGDAFANSPESPQSNKISFRATPENIEIDRPRHSKQPESFSPVDSAGLTARSLDEPAISVSEPKATREGLRFDPKVTNALISLRAMQEDSWTSRSEKPESHARVGLLQWEVDSSYLHPGYEFCDDAGTGFDAANPGNWTRSQVAASCSEARRRAILKTALQACHRFKVEILLLPEYSVRPETIEWLRSELSTLSPETSVWAGTYRLPPGMSKPSLCADWSAIHELVLPETSDRLCRAKKYSSVAADEVFHPGPNTLLPLFGKQVIGDVRSYIFELVCSEVFLVTCPANLRPLARARRELLRKFGARLGTKNLEATIREEIVSDVMEFARLTGLSEGSSLRRTILLVPAMTAALRITRSSVKRRSYRRD